MPSNRLQSALYLNEALARPGAKNITKLSFAKNKKLQGKCGVFIGDALIRNPDHPVEKISFKKVNLGENGLLRIIEAANVNSNIRKLHMGVISDRALLLMAETLKKNTTLEKLKFTEDPDNTWSESSKHGFIEMLKQHKNLIKVKFEPADKDGPANGHKLFKKEIEFFVKKIKKEHRTNDEMEDRINSCAPDHMFKDLLKMIEDKDEHEKMPVRKFFNNTFGTLLNDAIFALMKKQSKSKST